MKNNATSLSGGGLAIIATPIGNLEDITFRAVRVLREVELILAEDTRRSRILIDHYGIPTPIRSYHEYSSRRVTESLISRMKAGARFALISDAGSPLVSDPGRDLVRQAIESSIRIDIIPGPSAVIAALMISGLPTVPFSFEGYLPKTEQKLRNRLEWLKANNPGTIVAFVSPHTFIKTLEAITVVYGASAQIVVCRELTKLHEEIYRGSIKNAREHFTCGTIRGEITLLLAPFTAAVVDWSMDDLRAKIRALKREGIRARAGVETLTAGCSLSKHRLYELWHEDQKGKPNGS